MQEEYFFLHRFKKSVEKQGQIFMSTLWSSELGYVHIRGSQNIIFLNLIYFSYWNRLGEKCLVWR